MGRIGGNPGNKGGGRKTRGQELALVQWYESVLPQVFGIVKEKLNSPAEKDKLWAMEWLKTGIVKMIPQKIGGDENNKNPIPILVKFINANTDTTKDD